MLIIGWKMGADFDKASRAVHKHTGLPLNESKRLIGSVIEGNTRKLPDDFVLREDLEECKFIIQ